MITNIVGSVLLVLSPCSLALLSSGLAFADSARQESNIESVFQFMKTNLVGRRLVTPTQSGEIDGGKLQYEFQRTLIYSDLVRTERGIKYNTNWVVAQTNFRVSDGQRILPGENKDRLGTATCELRSSLSIPGKITGFCRSVSSSFFDSTGSVSEHHATLDGPMLILTSQTVGFADHFANSTSGYKPGSSTTRTEISLENGKVIRVDRTSSVDLDPISLAPMAGTELQQTMIAREP